MNWNNGKATAGILTLSVERTGEAVRDTVENYREWRWYIRQRGDWRDIGFGYARDELSACRDAEEYAESVGRKILADVGERLQTEQVLPDIKVDVPEPKMTPPRRVDDISTEAVIIARVEALEAWAHRLDEFMLEWSRKVNKALDALESSRDANTESPVADPHAEARAELDRRDTRRESTESAGSSDADGVAPAYVPGGVVLLLRTRLADARKEIERLRSSEAVLNAEIARLKQTAASSSRFCDWIWRERDAGRTPCWKAGMFAWDVAQAEIERLRVVAEETKRLRYEFNQTWADLNESRERCDRIEAKLAEAKEIIKAQDVVAANDRKRHDALVDRLRAELSKARRVEQETDGPVYLTVRMSPPVEGGAAFELKPFQRDVVDSFPRLLSDQDFRQGWYDNSEALPPDHNSAPFARLLHEGWAARHEWELRRKQ